MDNRVGEMEAFLQVAERGSFAAAAKALRLTPSAISRAITRLETRLNLRLIQRTTRALALTAEGEAYRLRAGELLAELDEMERSLTTDAAEPRGKLRVNASVPFGTHFLLPLLPRFLAANPKMVVDVSLSDQVIDLMGERADVAIRIGPLAENRLKARFLGRSRMVVVAAPSYLKAHGTPDHPDDLDRHNCLNFNFRRSVDSWPFRMDGITRPRTIQGNFLGNSGEVVRLMAVGGGGIARLSRLHVAADLQTGRLVPVLEDFNPGDSEDINALYLGHQRLSARVRAFVDFLAAHLSVSA